MKTKVKNINNYANEMYNCENGAWYEVLYTYQYGNELYEIDDYKTEIYANSSEEAIRRFFYGDKTYNISKKSDDFCNRVININAYVK